MFQQRVSKHVGVYVCRVLYYEVHLLDDILIPLRQHSSGETGENNENHRPSSLHGLEPHRYPILLVVFEWKVETNFLL
jgi:hypothetical protein